MESVTREQLRELFSQAGEVTKVDIPDGGRSMVSVLVLSEALTSLLGGGRNTRIALVKDVCVVQQCRFARNVLA